MRPGRLRVAYLWSGHLLFGSQRNSYVHPEFPTAPTSVCTASATLAAATIKTTSLAASIGIAAASAAAAAATFAAIATGSTEPETASATSSSGSAACAIDRLFPGRAKLCGDARRQRLQ